MIITQISDTHIALDTDDADRRLADFQAVIDDINALDPAPDLIIHTGDIVHNGHADEYAAAATILAKARAPVYVMAGNKDDRANLRRAFPTAGYLDAASDFIAYEITGHPVRLLALDTLSATSNKGDFCEPRATGLIGMIDAEPTKPIVVFTHHPPFEVLVGPERIHFETLEAMSRLRSALMHGGRVRAVISGHVHRPTTGDVDGIPAVVMTAVATALRKGEYPAGMQGRPTYNLYHIDHDGQIVTERRFAGKPA